MKRFLIVFIIVLLVPLSVNAEQNSQYNDYLSEFDLSVFKENLNDETYNYLEELGIADFNYNSVSGLGFNDFLNILAGITKDKLSSPVKCSLSILIFIVLSSLIESFKSDSADGMGSVYSTCSALVISIVLVSQMSPAIGLASSSIKIAGDFIFAFIPVFSAIIIASGGVSTALASNSMLLMMSQCLSFISANVFMPIINCFLAIGICSSIRAELALSNVLNAIRKGITSVISFLCAVFVSILSIKTSISARADMLGIRSIRFVINSVVPVIGGSVSEGLLSINTYSSLIKSGVGIVGIIAVALLFLPSIIEIAIWRITFSLSSLLCGIFGNNSVSATLDAFKNTALLINVVLILSMVTTIISFGLLIAMRTV